MKIQSDKKRIIYNIVPFIFFDKKNFNTVEKISVDLSLVSTSNKNWIFYSKLIPLDNFTNEIYSISQKKNNVNIIYVDRNITKKKFSLLLKFFYLSGKKIIIIFTKKIKHKYNNQEFIYTIRGDINTPNLKRIILNYLEAI